MATEEILWNLAICASTYAELGESWATIRAINSLLDDPDGGRVLYETGATEQYNAAHELVMETLRGLDTFLGIQGNYLDGIRKGVRLDLSGLKSKFDGSGEEPAYQLQEAAGAAIRALGKKTSKAQVYASPENYASRTDASNGEIYPGLFAYETPPPWLNDWLQFVAYGGSPSQTITKSAPWTDQVQYAGA